MEQTPIIPRGFWEELYHAKKPEWPSVIRKYNLDQDVEKLNYIAANREAVFQRKNEMREGRKAYLSNANCAVKVF